MGRHRDPGKARRKLRLLQAADLYLRRQAGADGLLPWLQDLRRQLPDGLPGGRHGARGVPDLRTVAARAL